MSRWPTSVTNPFVLFSLTICFNGDPGENPHVIGYMLFMSLFICSFPLHIFLFPCFSLAFWLLCCRDRLVVVVWSFPQSRPCRLHPVVSSSVFLSVGLYLGSWIKPGQRHVGFVCFGSACCVDGIVFLQEVQDVRMTLSWVISAAI